MMRMWICVVMSVAALGAAPKTKAKAAPPAKRAAAKAPAAKAPQVTIPHDAVEVEPGTFAATDAQGKRWLYRKTPWGVAKFEDRSAELKEKNAKLAEKDWEHVTATEDGDVIRFERPGPFGKYKWQTRKADLSEMEKAAWERERAKVAQGDRARQE